MHYHAAPFVPSASILLALSFLLSSLLVQSSFCRTTSWTPMEGGHCPVSRDMSCGPSLLTCTGSMVGSSCKEFWTGWTGNQLLVMLFDPAICSWDLLGSKPVSTSGLGDTSLPVLADSEVASPCSKSSLFTEEELWRDEHGWAIADVFPALSESSCWTHSFDLFFLKQKKKINTEMMCYGIKWCHISSCLLYYYPRTPNNSQQTSVHVYYSIQH